MDVDDVSVARPCQVGRKLGFEESGVITEKGGEIVLIREVKVRRKKRNGKIERGKGVKAKW